MKPSQLDSCLVLVLLGLQVLAAAEESRLVRSAPSFEGSRPSWTFQSSLTFLSEPPKTSSLAQAAPSDLSSPQQGEHR